MKKRDVAIAMAIVLGTSVSHAEEAVLNPMVVTAPAMTDPFIIELDPKQPVQPVPASDGASYLKNIPGFSVVRKGGTDGDLAFRGLIGSRLGISQDDAMVLGGCGMRMDPPTAYIYPESFDKVVITKGPQTVLHGGGNVAATVQFERNTPRFEEAGMRFLGSALFGSFGRNDQMVDATAGGTQGFARIIGTRSSSDNHEDGDGNPVHSFYTRWSGSAIGGWTPNQDTRVEISADRSNGEAAYADRSMDGTKFDRTGYGARYVQSNVSGRVEKIEAKVYHNYVDHVMDNYSLRTPAAMKSVSNPDRTTDGARVALQLNMGASALTTVGVDYQSNEHTMRSIMGSMTIPDINTRERNKDASFKSTGLFTETDYSAGDRDRIVGGVRADWAEATAENVMAPYGGAVAGTTDKDTNIGLFIREEHQLAQSPTTLYAGVGRATRSPDYWERARVFNLDNEKSTQLDVGVKYKAEKTALNVAMFYANIDDYIIISTTAPMARNVDATLYGGEADYTYRLAGNWQSRATLAYVWGNNDSDDKALPQISPLEGTVSLGYDNRIYSANLLVRGVANQERVDVGSGSIAGMDIGESSGFAIASFNVGYRPSRVALLTAGVDNIFDRTYAEHISRSGEMVVIPGFEQTTRVNEPGRSYWIKANVTF
jgi:iron complex outermembrane receptor protein